jgi:PTS system fructose-specific IIA component/PTS system nitrogen regulatory IIA component
MSLEKYTQCVLMLDDRRITNRDAAVDAILMRMAELSLVPESLVAELRAAVIRRDELGPTGIGEGVAIPHAGHPGLDRMLVALGVSRRGLEYPSLDGERVHIILMVLTPTSRPPERPKQTAFDVWLRHLREPAFRASLRLAETTEDLRAALRAGDRSVP